MKTVTAVQGDDDDERKKNLIARVRKRFAEKTDIVLGVLPDKFDHVEDQEKIIAMEPSVWIHGLSGHGKTMTAARLAWKLYSSNHASSFTEEVTDLIKVKWDAKSARFLCKDIICFMSYDLCRAFQDATLNQDEYNPKKDCLYVIDDIDKIKMTEFREEQLFRFFDICVKQEIKMIVTSQLSIKDFASKFDGANFVIAIERRLSKIFSDSKGNSQEVKL